MVHHIYDHNPSSHNSSIMQCSGNVSPSFVISPPLAVGLQNGNGECCWLIGARKARMDTGGRGNACQRMLFVVPPPTARAERLPPSMFTNRRNSLVHVPLTLTHLLPNTPFLFPPLSLFHPLSLLPPLAECSQYPSRIRPTLTGIPSSNHGDNPVCTT